MGFQVSPGIVTNEIDLTTIVPAVSTTVGAIAGVFRWGPFQKLVLVDSEVTLGQRFGTPTNFNAETWFTAADFLAYADSLQISRAGTLTGVSYHRAFTGNSTNLAIQANTATLAVNSTANLAVGQILFYSNAVGIAGEMNSSNPPSIASIVNATAITLTENSTANIQSIDVVFRDSGVYPAVAQETQNVTIPWANQLVPNEEAYPHLDGTFDPSVNYIARFGGSKGDSLRVSVCDHPTQFQSNIALVPNVQINAAATSIQANVGSNTLTITVTPANTSDTTSVSSANATAGTARLAIGINDLIQIGNTRIGYQYLQVASVSNVTSTGNVFTFTVGTTDTMKLGGNISSNVIPRYWEFFNLVEKAPGASPYNIAFGNAAAFDELHVVVVDEDGDFTRQPGTVLEVWRAMSRASDAKAVDGGTNYYKNVINQGSQYIWWANDRTEAVSNTAPFITSSTGTAPMNLNFYGGSDGPDESNVSIGALTFAYDQFQSTEDVDISLVMQGKARGLGVSNYTQLGNYIIQNLAEVRKDCVAFVSPDKSYVVNNTGNELSSILAARANMPSSSYGVLDSGYYYRYDRYNDIYRWIPLNGQIAGLCVRTDNTNDAWWSPAGFKRGILKNVVRLAYSPRKPERDGLYKAGVNPVVTFNSDGTVLFGDKTMLDLDSAFNRINVRRLFIVLEKAISRMARAFLFEFNDDFTRAQFKAIVVPYLKDIQGRRGITDFLVVCDTTNNTAEVRMRNEFIGDIYIKPNHSINFITLNFVAVRDDVAFSEVVGKF